MQKKFYIVTPGDDIENICEEFLDRDTSFHSEIKIIDGDSVFRLPAWEVNMDELLTIHKSATEKGFSLSRFRVATRRTQRKETFRWVQKKEYIRGYQSQNKRPENSERIRKARKEKLQS